MTGLIRNTKCVVAACAVLLISCDSSSKTLAKPTSNRLTPRLEAIFNTTKLACVGRFIIRVPSTATLVYGPASIDARIQYLRGESARIDEHIKQTLEEIEEDRKFLSKKNVIDFPLFGTVTDGATAGQKFVYGSPERIGYSLSSFIPVGADLYVQSLTYAEPLDESIATLNLFAKNLRRREPDEIPFENGICIEGGFVSHQAEYETSSLGVRLKEFPDVHFSVRFVKNGRHIPEYEDLETRLKRAESEGGSWHSRVKYFRRAPRQLGAWQGYEALALKPAQAKETASHEFHFISMGAPNDRLQPRLSVELDTGASGTRKGALKPSISNDEAVAVWDRLIGSIRVRPTDGIPDGVGK